MLGWLNTLSRVSLSEMKGGPVMLYFVKENKLHRYPVPLHCNVKLYGNEVIRDTIPHGIEQCEYCLKWWPGDKAS
jgi:hypothetical protein